MTRYAAIEMNSGFIWGVEDADDVAEAVAKMVRYLDPADSAEYVETWKGDDRKEFVVYEAPADYECNNGQDDDAIAEVGAMPVAGYVKRAD